MGALARPYGHCVRHWTLDEATAALPDVREKVQRLRQLLTARPTANGQGARLDAEIAALIVASSRPTASSCAIPERGLIDFPALAPSGETYLLCWLDGEDAIDWWHWPDAGFAGRTPITDTTRRRPDVAEARQSVWGTPGALRVRERGADDAGLVEQLRGRRSRSAPTPAGAGTCPTSC